MNKFEEDKNYETHSLKELCDEFLIWYNRKEETSNSDFKIGDRVKGEYDYYEYTGTVIRIYDEGEIGIDRDDKESLPPETEDWICCKVNGRWKSKYRVGENLQKI